MEQKILSRLKRIRVDKRRIIKIYVVTILIIFVALTLRDLTVHFLPFDRGCPHGIEVFDVYGYLSTPPPNVCYHRGLDIWGFRQLGKTDADTIVIITHFFTSDKTVGMGVSDNSDAVFLLTHPVSVFYVVKGTADGKSYLAVSPGIMSLSSGLKDKTIILITCDLAGTDKFAEAFIRAGAKEVLVSNIKQLSIEKIHVYLNAVLVVNSTDRLCSSGLFKCYR